MEQTGKILTQEHLQRQEVKAKPLAKPLQPNLAALQCAFRITDRSLPQMFPQNSPASRKKSEFCQPPCTGTRRTWSYQHWEVVCYKELRQHLSHQNLLQEKDGMQNLCLLTTSTPLWNSAQPACRQSAIPTHGFGFQQPTDHPQASSVIAVGRNPSPESPNCCLFWASKPTVNRI